MAVYEYTAKDGNGSPVSGIYEDIDSVAVLRDELTKVGCTLLKARRKKVSTENGRENVRRKIKPSEVVTFAYEFAGMCSAGLSILKCLETLEEQTGNQAFKHILFDIRCSVETGSSLKDAFEKHSNVFSDFFVGMIEAGESGGKLSETLEISAVYLEKQLELRRKVNSAFAYPVIVGIISLVVVGCLVIFVVPVFSKLYQQLHVALPGPTQALVSFSSLVRNWWWMVLIVVTCLILLFRRLLKNPRLKVRWDVLKLNIPLFGRLNRMVVVSNFIRTFAMLVLAGVPLVKALDVASRVAHNSRLSEIAEQLKQSIEAGNPVAGSLKNYDIFPPIITQLAAAGDEAGMLPDMLNKGVDFLEKDIDRAVSALLVKLEPAMTVIMGLVVGFVLMAVYLPMFDYMRHLK